MKAFLVETTGYHWLQPHALWLSLLVPIAWWWRRRRKEPAVPFAPLALLEVHGIPRSWRARLAGLPRLLLVLACASIVLAMARPTHRVPDPVVREGIDILLVFDRSSSMAEKDLDPKRTRLDVVRETAIAFTRARVEDRLGIVAFARYPDVVCPPTLDHAAVETFLTQLEPVDATSSEDQTGIGTAVARAAQLLSFVESPSRVLIVLTDGAENVAGALTPQEIEPMEAAELCRAHAVRVYTIQAGRGRTETDGTFHAIDTEPLRRMAVRTGGRFFEARDAQSLTQVYEAIDALERRREEELRFRFEERGSAFIAFAFVAAFLAWLLDRTWLEVLP